MNSEILTKINEVHWRELNHAYGSCEDFGKYLGELFDGSGAAVTRLLDAFSELAHHQGTHYEVTPILIPFLMDAVGYRKDDARANILRFLGELVGEGQTSDNPTVEQQLADRKPLIEENAMFADTLSWRLGLHAESIRNLWPERDRLLQTIFDASWRVSSSACYAITMLIRSRALESFDEDVTAFASLAVGAIQSAIDASEDADHKTSGIIALAHLSRIAPEAIDFVKEASQSVAAPSVAANALVELDRIDHPMDLPAVTRFTEVLLSGADECEHPEAMPWPQALYIREESTELLMRMAQEHALVIEAMICSRITDADTETHGAAAVRLLHDLEFATPRVQSVVENLDSHESYSVRAEFAVRRWSHVPHVASIEARTETMRSVLAEGWAAAKLIVWNWIGGRQWQQDDITMESIADAFVNCAAQTSLQEEQAAYSRLLQKNEELAGECIDVLRVWCNRRDADLTDHLSALAVAGFGDQDWQWLQNSLNLDSPRCLAGVAACRLMVQRAGGFMSNAKPLDPRANRWLLSVASHEDPEVRIAILDALACDQASESEVAGIIQLLFDDDESVRIAAAQRIGCRCELSVVRSALGAVLQSDHRSVCAAVIEGLRHDANDCDDEQLVERIVEYGQKVNSLGALTEILELLLECKLFPVSAAFIANQLGGEDVFVRRAAANSVAHRSGIDQLRDAIFGALDDADEEVKASMAAAVGSLLRCSDIAEIKRLISWTTEVSDPPQRTSHRRTWSVASLATLLSNDPPEDEGLRQEILQAIAGTLADPSDAVHRMAVRQLALLGESATSIAPRIIELLEDRNARDTLFLLDTLHAIAPDRTDEITPRLKRLLDTADEIGRQGALNRMQNWELG